MRRFLCIIIAIGMAFSLYGCSSSFSSLDDITQTMNEKGSDPNGSESELMALAKAFELDPSNREIVSDLIALHKERGDYKSCIEVYDVYLANAYNDLDSLIDLAYCQMYLKDYDKARETCEKAIKLNNYSAEAHNALGNVYGDLTEYQKALESYRKASVLDESFLPSRTNTLWALFNSSQYEKCIQEAKNQADSGYECYDLYYYIGGSYEALNKFTEAEAAYHKALEFEFEDYSDTYYHLGLMAYFDEKYDKAAEFTKTALNENPQNQDALWLEIELEKLNVPLNERISEFIDDQYLYKYEIEDFGENIKKLNKASTAYHEVIDLCSQMLHPNDPFSSFIQGNDYDAYRFEQESLTVSRSPNNIEGMDYELFKIDYFTPMTGKEFITIADRIENIDQKVLVIDLRGNPGGDMKASSEILDYFLGDCVTVNFINRDGYISSYYSNADRVHCRKLIILTDAYTASAAELLTLGLKIYMPETLLIGENTYGKGVSQLQFNDAENKLAFWLVNSYWNVREINIHGYGIPPDVEAKTQNEIDSALQNALSMIQ